MITDFYNNFFHFGISESEFIQYGISETIFPDKDKAYDDRKQKKEDFLSLWDAAPKKAEAVTP